MTALKDIAKIETTGLWRAEAEGQRIDVFVALGDSSLVISDINDKALAHWSLPAIQRVSSGKTPAVYAPGSDSVEELEISDPTMIDALERLTSAIERARPKPGRLRIATFALLTTLTVTLAVFWLPRALEDHTLRVVPDAQRAAIGADLLQHLTALTGAPCGAPRAVLALDRLNARILPGADATLVVLNQAVKPTMHLPGGLLLLSNALLEDYDDPEVLAGYVVTEYMRSQMQDPLQRYLAFAGFQETFRLLTTGRTDPALRQAFIERELTRPPSAVPAADTLDWFGQLGLPTSPFAWALDPTGETVLELIEADPYASTPAPEVLSDAQWLTLRNICLG